MQIKAERYSYNVPGFEKHSFKTMQEVYNHIEELANIHEIKINEEEIDKLYSTHKVNAKEDVHFRKMHESLIYLESKKPESKFYQTQKAKFISTIVQRNYYAYIYKDFKKYGLSLKNISWLKSLRQEYLKVCKTILPLYDSEDFIHVSPPKDLGLEKARKNAKEAKEHYQKTIRLKQGIRQEYNAKVKMTRAEIHYQNYKIHPKYKPIHYIAIALERRYKVNNLSITALKGIVIYHLQSQRKAKNKHNAAYPKYAARNASNKPSKNTESIANWILANPGNQSKSSCAQSIGVHRTTVHRNWDNAKKVLLQKI